MKPFFYPFLLLSCLVRSPLTADPAATSLEACYAAALEHNEALGIQEEALRQAREHVRQAWGALAPSLTGSAYQNWSFSPEGQYPAPSGSPVLSQPVLKASLNQPLFRGGREFAALGLMHAGEDAETYRREALKAQLYADLASAFFLVQSAEQELKNLRGEAALFEERIHDLKGRARIGRSQNSEVLSVEAAAAALDAARIETQGNLLVAREQFAFLSGLPAETLLAEESPRLDLMALDAKGLDALLSRRPDLRAAEARLRAAESNVDLNHGLHWPNLDFNANYYHYTQGIAQPAGTLNDSLWDAQLMLSLPLFNGFQSMSKVREAKSQAAQARLALSLAKRQARQELKSLQLGAQSQQDQIAALKKAVQIAGENYRTQRHNYTLGLVTNLDVLQALVGFQENQRALDRAGYRFKESLARLRAAAFQAPE